MVFSVQRSTTGMKPGRVVPLRETIGSKIDERKGREQSTQRQQKNRQAKEEFRQSEMPVAKVGSLAASDCLCLLLPGNHIFLNADRDTTIAMKFHGECALTLSHAAQVGRITKGFS